MAPFKFGKKSKDKNNSPKNSSGSSPSRFLHLHNSNHDSSVDAGFNNTLNSESSGIFRNPSPQQPQVQQRHVQQQNHSPIPRTPQFPKYEVPTTSRMIPTPTPIQQRNVSGATSAPLHYDTFNQQHPQLPREKTVWNRIRLANSPFPRYRHVASSYITDNDNIYVIGGLHDQSVYGDTWIIKSENNGTKFLSQTVDINDNTPPPRVGHAATLCGNAFVVFGGDTHKVNNDGLMDDDIYLFNINSYKWTIPHPVGSRPIGRYGHKICIIATSQMKTKLYLFGGQFDETYFNDISVFDLSSFRRPDSHWEFLKPKTFIPPPLTNHTMVSYAHKLWVFGGDTLQGLINQIFMFDPTINDWSIIEPRNIGDENADIPPPMQEHAALVYKDLMCVIGGKDEQDIYLNSVYFFNLKSFKWFKLPVFNLGIPQGRSGHSISLLKNDKILIMGGDKFDYARIDNADLHTSDVNMGKGTILYTLDLSNIEDLCPGILDDLSTPSTDEKMRFDGALTKNQDTNNNAKNNASIMNENDIENRKIETTPTTKSSAMNPVQIQNNILTPYNDSENQQTPNVEIVEKFRGVSSDHHSILGNDSEQHEEHDISNASVVENKAIFAGPLSVTQTEETEQIDKINETIDELTNVTVAEEKEEELKKEVEEEIKGASPDIFEASTQDKSAIVDTVQSIPKPEIEIPKPVLQEKSIVVPSVVPSVVPLTSPEMPVLQEKSIVVPPVVPLASPENPAVSKDKFVDKKVLEAFRDELQKLKDIAHEKSIEASNHITDLESEIQRLKLVNSNVDSTSTSKSVDSNKLQNRYNILESDTMVMRDRILELESLLDDRFLDLNTLNVIIKEQKETIDKYSPEDMNATDKISDLEQKMKQLTKENSQLKVQLGEKNSEVNKNINVYTTKIDDLLTRWNGSTKLKDLENGNAVEGENAEDNEKFIGYTPHHRQVVTNLSNQLDDLVQKSQGLSESKDKLNTEYQHLETKHNNMSQDLLFKQTELEKVTQNYNKSLKSINNTSKALEISQEELEKIRATSKKLKEELEDIKLHGDSNSLNFSDTSKSKEGSDHNGSNESSARDAQFDMKISDLKAELYIIRQERDTMKDEMLELKKKLLNLKN